MKKFRVVGLILLFVLVFSSCNVTKNAKEHQEIKNEVVSYNEDEMFRISLSEAGLKNVFIQQATGFEKLENDADWCKVILLGDDRFEQSKPCDYYLAVVSGGKVYLKDLAEWEDQLSYGIEIELCDFDGDGDKEMLLQQTVAMSGGAGQYLSRVFDFVNGEFLELYCSRNDEIRQKSTGFSIEILKENKFKIRNSITGYDEIFDFKNKPEKYLKGLYDKNGDVIERKILVDSFFEFIPSDIDDDGVYEIVCRQYVSLIDHTDHIGDAKTILKYNNKTDTFEIIDAEFEPYED